MTNADKSSEKFSGCTSRVRSGLGAKQFMAVAEIAMAEAEIANDTAEGKRIVAQRKIGLGVKKHELEKALGLSLGDGEAEMAVDPNNAIEDAEI